MGNTVHGGWRAVVGQRIQMQQGGDVMHKNVPCILSNMSTGHHIAVTGQSHHSEWGDQHIFFSFLAVIFRRSSVEQGQHHQFSHHL